MSLIRPETLIVSNPVLKSSKDLQNLRSEDRMFSISQQVTHCSIIPAVSTCLPFIDVLLP